MTKDETLKMALEALEKHAELGLLAGATITAIREALALSESSTKCEVSSHAQPEQWPENVQYTGNGTAGREADVRPTGFFFQMPPQPDYRAMYLKVRDELAELQQRSEK